MRRLQRLAAYALLRPDPTRDEVVLVEASRRSDLAGRWFLPGGGVDHGEHPDAAVVREVEEETGLRVAVRSLRQVVTDVVDLPHRDVQVHTVRLVHEVDVVGGTLRPEQDGSSERLVVLAPAEAARLRLAPYVAVALGLPPVGLGELRPDLAALHPLSGVGGGAGASGAERRLRVGVYGVALRGEGGSEEVLLTRLADHVGGPGRWTLPGGGLDHGETVEQGLRREVHEETGLDVRALHLLGTSSTHFTGRSPAGVLEDFHGVRLLHQVDVSDGEPRVVEVDGSTAEARWVPVAGLARLGVAQLVVEGLRLLGHPAARTLGR